MKKEFLPIYKDEKTAQLFIERWDEMEQRIDYIAMPFIFIAQKLIDIEFYQAWEEFKERASNDNAEMSERIKNRISDILYRHIEGDPIQSLYCDLENEYNRIIVAMRNYAEADLDIISAVKPKWCLAILRMFERIKQPFRGSDETVQDPPSATEE